MKYRVYASTKIQPGDDLFSLTEKMVTASGHSPDGSGVGFGNRDLEFTVNSLDEAMVLENRFIEWASKDNRAAQVAIHAAPTAEDVSDAITKVLNDLGDGRGFDDLLHQRLYQAVMDVVKEKLED